MAFETIILQAEGLTVDTTLAANGDTLVRTRTENQEKDGLNGLGQDIEGGNTANPGLPEFDDYGLRPDYTGTGYVDPNGAAGDKVSFAVNDGAGPALPAGTYDVTLRVASASNRSIKLRVLDGDTVESETSAEVVNTAEFYLWDLATFSIVIPEGAPARTIVIEQTSGAGPNIDAVAISEPGAAVTFAAPEITSAATFTVDENTTEVGQVAASDLQDVSGTDGALVYALSGDDADKLSIGPDGTLTLDAAPDFEAPADADGDGVYEASVAVSDGVETTTQAITVTVLDDTAEALAQPAIEPIVLQGEDAAIGAEGESFARTQAAALADAEAGAPYTIAEGAPNTVKGGNADEPIDAYGLRAGYSGTGYLDFEQGADETLAWTVSVTEAGAYDLHVRYANGGQDRPLDIVVGGAVQHAAQSFAGTGFQTWETKTFTVVLETGDNQLVLAIAGSTNGPNVDAVAITSVGETPDFPPANTPPAFAPDVAAAVAVDEGATSVGAFAATDDDGDAVGYALSGPDAALFAIDAAGDLSFAAAPDFDAPADADGDNIYEVTVEAGDGELTTATDVAVTVADADEATPFEPILVQAETAAVTTATGDTRVLTQTNDLDEGTSGDEATKDVFNLRPNYSGAGYLDFGSANDGSEAVAYAVDSPVAGTFDLHLRYASSTERSVDLTDAAGTRTLAFAPTTVAGEDPFDNWSVVTVPVTLVAGANTLALALFDGNGPNLDALAVTAPGEAPDFAPRFTTEGAFAVEEGATAVGTVGAVDVDADTTDADDAVGAVAFSIAGGADAGLFAIDAASGALGFAAAPDFEAPADADGDNVYEVVVAVTDAAGNAVEQAVAVGVTDDPADDAAANAAPTVADATAATVEDVAVEIDVADLVADDTDADAELTITAEATNGSVSVAGTTLSFTPAADFDGEATITYRAEDSEGAVSGDATIAVSVAAADDAPSAVALTPVAVAENAPGAVVADIAIADVDTDYGPGDVVVSDPATFRVIGAPGALQLALAEGVALDFEADAQPSVTVTAGGVASAPFAPAPANDAGDDAAGPVVVTFDAAALSSYSNQDRPGAGGAGASASEDGGALTLDGNLWKRAPLPVAYEITATSKLAVTIEIGAAVPEIVAIGFDDDDVPFEQDKTVYQIAGPQGQSNFTDLRGQGVDNGDGTITFTIDLSAQAGASHASMVFVADDDLSSDGLGSVVFSDVRLFEDEGGTGNRAPRVVGGGVADFSVDEGDPIEVDLPFVDDDGDALSYAFAITDAAGAPVTVEGLTLADGVLAGPAPSEPGVYTVALSADDGTAGIETGFELTVLDVNEPPVAEQPALEPYVGAAGQPFTGLDLATFAAFFTDPDAGDALTLSAEGLPAGLSVNEEGVIEGVPLVGGTTTAIVRATDTEGASATIEITFQIDGVETGETVVVEAEAFTGLAEAQNMFATGVASASGEQVLRAGGTGSPSSASTDLTANGLVEGYYRVSMTFYDETDGDPLYSLVVGDTALAENQSFADVGTFDFPNEPRGGAAQKGNLKTVAFDQTVFVTEGTVMTLSGQRDGELMRVDRFAFTRVEAPNEAPVAIALDDAAVTENVAGDVVGTLSATDPDGDDAAIVFSVDAASDFEVDGATLKLKEGVALDFEQTPAVDVAVTATDAGGAASTTTLSVAVADVDEAPGAVVLSSASVDENAAGAVIGTLSASDGDGGAVASFTTADPRFAVAGDQLSLAPGVALDHETEETVSLDVLADGAAAPTTLAIAVADVDEAPTLSGGVGPATVPAGGGSVSLAGLVAADEDEGQTPLLAVRLAGGDPAPEGVAIENGALTIPAGLPAGTLALEIVAVDPVDAALESAPVALDVTVGEPAPFAPFAIQAEDGVVTLANAPDEQSTQVRDPDNVESNPNLENGLRPGFSGTGYVDYGNDAGDTLTLAVEVATAGSYDLNVRYASNTARPLDLAINGTADGQLPFASTDPDGAGGAEGFDTWAFETRTVTLQAGANTVALAIPAGADTGPNLDRIEITEAGTGPIPVDDSADADAFPLTLDGPTGALNETQAASINLNVSGDDDDIVRIEVSFDGGTTRLDVTDIVDADGDFVVDGSALAAGPQTATLVVTDAAGNEATATLDFSIADATGGGTDPVTIQAEDETQVTVIDVGAPGNNGQNVTREAGIGNPDAFGNERTGAVGDAYVDFGTDPGDAVSVAFDAPQAGTYELTLRYANGSAEIRPLALTVNGAGQGNVAFAPTAAPSQDLSGWEGWTDLTVEVDLQAGANTVAFAIPTAAQGGVDNGPNIDQLTFALKDDGTGGGEAEVFEEIVAINFEAPASGNGAFDAPPGYATPAGFEADTGAAYGDRGNGFSYGWVDVDDATGTPTSTPLAQPTGSMRYKNAVAEASDLQKTYAHFDYPGAPAGDRERAWEIALQNGVYELTVAIGDTAEQYDSSYVLDVEGETFGPSWEPVNLAGQKLVGGAYDASFDGEGFRSNLYTGIVEVADGRLTIDGTGGDNVEIQWLDIARVPDLTPDDGRSADLDYSKFVSPVAASLEDGQVSIEIDENGEVPLGIDPTSSLVVGVELQAIDHRGPAVAFTDGITLTETLTGEAVAINVQVTGGADSLTIKPLEGLKEFTSYTLDIKDVLDLGNLTDSSLPQRQFQDLSTTFVTGETPEVVAREVAFADTVVLDGFADGGAAYTSIEFGPDGRLYVSSILGEIHRWDVNADGTLDKASKETLSLDYFSSGGRSIIGLAFDPADPDTIWVTDNAPVPRQGKADETPDFSGQISKITLGAGGSFADAEAETYVTGLPRSGGDHVTNSLEFRANPDAGDPGAPDHLLYLTQGSNSAAGRPDNAWGFRPERLLNAAALEVDPRRDAPDGGFDVQTEPYDPSVNAPTYRDPSAVFGADGTVAGFYDPFAADAVLKIFGEGIRNAYDLVWHSNGFLYTPTNGTARGGNTLDDPNTAIDEEISGLDKQFDYLFQVQEGGYYGHPNPLLGNYVVNGGAGGPDNIYGSDNSANTSDNGNEYAAGVVRDEDYDIDGSYSLGFNKSPNGATEYTGNAFGTNLQGALLFAQFSVGDNVRVINVDPVTGRVTGDDVLRRPGGDVIDEYIDPLDIIENPATGQLYLMTLNRGSGESRIVLLNPAPGGVVGDVTADEGGDLALVVVDDADPAAVVFQVDGLDADIETTEISVNAGAAQAVTLDGQNRFTLDLAAFAGQVTVRLDVEDDDANTAQTQTALTIGEPGESVFIDATQFTVLSALAGEDATVIRNIDDPSTYEPTGGNDADGDGLNDGYDGLAYLDPNGGPEDKASFVFDAPAAGTYSFVFRMANGSGAARPIAIKTGTQSVALADTSTGDFVNWVDFPVTLTMDAGANTIVVEQTGQGAPNIDSVSVTPLDVAADTTADEGGNLDLVAADLSDPAQAVFTVSGADDDLVSLSVIFDDGDNTATVTPTGNGDFTVDLSGLSGAVTATLTVEDDAGNTAVETASVTLQGGTVANDGTETVGGVDFVVYEAENAALTGTTDEVTTAEDDRGQRGGAFVDFDGAGAVSITWTVEVSQEGLYQVDVVYALAAGKAARPMALSVDGGPAQTVDFPPNSNAAETAWGPATVQLQLAPGVHTLAFTATGEATANLDYLRITEQPLGEPLDLTADEGGDLALVVLDQSDASNVVFRVDGLDDDIETLEVAFNGGQPTEVTLADGQFTADAGIALGPVEAVLTVTDDAANTATAETSFAVVPDGNENADIAVQSLDPTFYANRLHFSVLENDSASNPDRSFKDSAVVRISNTGTEDLTFADAQITGPFDLADPAAFDGLVLAGGASVDVTVLFDATEISPKPGNGQNGVYEGALTLTTNDAEDPIVSVDLAGFWQQRDEGGWEPNVNEVWQLFGFGNVIEGLSLQGGGENSVLNFFDVYIPVDETEVLSPYWRLADGASEATITQIAAFHGDGGASLGIHGPGDKSGANDVGFGGHAGDHNQRILPLRGNGEFFAQTFDAGDVPDAWAGEDLFGFEVAGLSTDPRLNPTGSGAPTQAQLDAEYPGQGYTVSNGTVFDAAGDEVPDGYTVRMYQAVDAEGEAIENVFLGVMDYTGINYDYNDNMFVVEGVTPAGFGGALTVSGLDDAAADDRLVFTNIEQPNNAGGLAQTFRNEATVTIGNDGVGTLDVAALSITGADAAAFEIVSGPEGAFSLAAGQSVAITVAFTGADGTDDNAAVLYDDATLSVTPSLGAARSVALAGLAQIQSEQGEEPTVAQIVQAFGYGTDVAQGELANGGVVETVGDEVLAPYLQALDPSQDVEVVNIAAFLQQGDVARLNRHDVGDAALSELYAGDDQQGQTVLPDGLVAGAGDTGDVARASFDGATPFGLKVTVDGRPTFAAWSDPDINVADPAFGIGGANEGHYLRFFEAKDADGAVIPGRLIAIQDYPGGGNFDYNDAMFVVTNVAAYDPAGAEDADGDGVVDVLETDADGDGLVAFFDPDDQPATTTQSPFPGPDAPEVDDGAVEVLASNYDQGGQGVAYNDAAGLQNAGAGNSGGDGGRAGSDVEVTDQGDIGWINPGEWLEYTVDVAEAGAHQLDLLLATNAGGRSVEVDVYRLGAEGQEATPYLSTGPIANPSTGSYTTFLARSAGALELEAGAQVIRVTFQGGSQDFRSLTLTPPVPANQAPESAPIANASADEGTAVSIDAAASFSDPDDDALTFTATGLPSGVTIDAEGSISGTAPEVAADTDFEVTVTASDGAFSASETFTLTVADVPVTGPTQAPFPGPDAPGFTDGTLTVAALDYDQGGQGVAYNDAAGLEGGSDGGRTGSDVEATGLGDIGWIAEGEWYEYTVDVDQAGLYDLDLLLAFGSSGSRSATVDFYAGSAATPYATSGPIANPSTGGWTTFAERSADGIALQAGEQVVRVTFQGGSQDFRSFTLTAEETPTPNQPPVSEAIGDETVTEGAAISIDVAAAFGDPDDDPLAYTVSGLAGLSIGPAGVVSGTAPQVDADTGYEVTVTASDGEFSVSEAFTLTVTDEPVVAPAQAPFPGPDAPSIGADAVTVDATDYDQGGQGVAWNDDPGRDGGNAFRSDTDVELVGAEDDIGYVEAGEWVEYTVDVAEAGTYDLSVLAKTPIGGNTISVSLEDGPTLASFALADANGAADDGFGGTAFAPSATQQIALAAGQQTLRFAFDGAPASNGYLLDFRSFTLDRVEETAEPGAIGEAGSVTVAQGGPDQWFSVAFAEALENPAVVMGPISSNDAQPATMRVRNVTDTGFEYQLDEWNYLDGEHAAETVSWIAIESGTHVVGGQTIVAGVGTASSDGSTIGFGESFAAAPAVFAQVTGTNDPDAVTDRIDAVTATGFDVALDEEEANTSGHAEEALAWIAVEAGGSAGNGLLAAVTGNSVKHGGASFDFGGEFADAFAFIADMQTEDGSDPATVRLDALDGGGGSFFIEEEQSSDGETNHTTEVVGYLSIEEGLIIEDSLTG